MTSSGKVSPTIISASFRGATTKPEETGSIVTGSIVNPSGLLLIKLCKPDTLEVRGNLENLTWFSTGTPVT